MSRDRGELKFGWVEGDLFVDGPSAADVQQGSLNDCYLMAAMAAVAHQRPGLLREAIRDNGDGTLSVRLHKKGLFGTKRVNVEIDGQLPTRFGIVQEYGRSARHDELWVGLLEKAFAAMKGGYEQIGEMGKAAHALTALTGQKAPFVELGREAKPDAVHAELTRRLERGQLLVVASTNDEGAVAGTGIRSRHSFAVVGTAEEGGARYVLLHDPAGAQGPHAASDEGGLLRVPVERFCALFQGYNAVG